MSSSREDAICCSLFCFRSSQCKHNVTLQIKVTDGLDFGGEVPEVDWTLCLAAMNSALILWSCLIKPIWCSDLKMDFIWGSKVGHFFFWMSLRWELRETIHQNIGSVLENISRWKLEHFHESAAFFYSETRRETKLSSAAAFTNKMSV